MLMQYKHLQTSFVSVESGTCKDANRMQEVLAEHLDLWVLNMLFAGDFND